MEEREKQKLIQTYAQRALTRSTEVGVSVDMLKDDFSSAEEKAKALGKIQGCILGLIRADNDFPIDDPLFHLEFTEEAASYMARADNAATATLH